MTSSARASSAGFRRCEGPTWMDLLLWVILAGEYELALYWRTESAMSESCCRGRSIDRRESSVHMHARRVKKGWSAGTSRCLHGEMFWPGGVGG